MKSTLKLPFALTRPGVKTPVTEADNIDISTIDGINSTNVQGALEEMADNVSAVKTNTENIKINLQIIKIHNQVIRSLQQNGLPSETAYGFVFMEEDALETLSPQQMSENIFYCGLEESEDIPTGDIHATYKNGYVLTGGTYSNGYVLDICTYSNGYVKI